MGRAMIVANIRMKFMTTKTVCSFPMILDMVEARIPWQQTQARNVPYMAPLEGVQLPSRAITMTERNMRANASAHHQQGALSQILFIDSYSQSSISHLQDLACCCSQLRSRVDYVSLAKRRNGSTSTSLRM